jgi:hypothetical protein
MKCLNCNYDGKPRPRRVARETHDFCRKCGYDLTLQERFLHAYFKEKHYRIWDQQRGSRIFGGVGGAGGLTGADSVIIHQNASIGYSSIGVNKYSNLVENTWISTNIENIIYTRFAVTGTFKGMSIYARANTLNQTIRLMLRINGANTALFYDILAGVAPDVDVAADVAVAIGDHVNWLLQPLAVPNAGTITSLSVCLWLRVP